MVESTATRVEPRLLETGQDGALVGAARKVEDVARRAKTHVAERSIGELVEEGRGYVRENPGKTILVSLGVGALVGYLIGRRRS